MLGIFFFYLSRVSREIDASPKMPVPVFLVVVVVVYTTEYKKKP